MWLMRGFTLFLMLFVMSACTGLYKKPDENVNRENAEVMTFAKANCLSLYFKKKNYDLKDINAITDGIVERGEYSAKTYQEVAVKVKAYRPVIKTRTNVDVDLLKCFKMDADDEFISNLMRVEPKLLIDVQEQSFNIMQF